MTVLHPSVRSPLPRITPLLAGALERRGWSVITTFWGGRSAREGATRKVVSRSLELGRALTKVWSQPGSLLFVNTAHTTKGVARDLPLVAGARVLGHGVVVLWHGSGPERVRARPRSLFALATGLLCRLSDAVLVLSGGELEEWRRIEPAGRFILVTNPYVTRMTPKARRPESPVTILFVGRLLRAKGVHELVDAFCVLAATTDCRLVIVGDGPERSALAGAVSAGGLDDRVEMPGYLDAEELRLEYERAHIFALPTYGEGFPTVISEAMDAGLPIVTTRSGGMVDHLVEGEHCLFVQPRDPRDLERALARLVEDPELRERMGAANRRVVEGFAPDAVVAVYDEVARSAHARHAAARWRA
jgi:glycosyltransferase involved in cell wall biosynthesis